eukprot:scaffold28248_cov66-Phaeocystis_antarctica.AAC.2
MRRVRVRVRVQVRVRVRVDGEPPTSLERTIHLVHRSRRLRMGHNIGALVGLIGFVRRLIAAVSVSVSVSADACCDNHVAFRCRKLPGPE